MPRKPPQTYHLLDVADSLKEQNRQVAELIGAVRTALSICGNQISEAARKRLDDAISKAHAAFFPRGE